MYYIDQELTDAAAYAPTDASFRRTRWQHFEREMT